MTRWLIWQRKEVTAQDSYRGKVYFALAMAEVLEGFTKVWVSCVREAVSWILETVEREIWGNHDGTASETVTVCGMYWIPQ
jgi:hypothetical protein